MVLGEGWRGGREVTDGTRDSCRGRLEGEKIHSVLISALRRVFRVLGAFYLDVAARVFLCLCVSLALFSFSFSLSLSLLSLPLLPPVFHEIKIFTLFMLNW